jgi:hypothetical protein
MVKKREDHQVTHTSISLLLKYFALLEYFYGANTTLQNKTLKIQQIMVVVTEVEMAQ